MCTISIKDCNDLISLTSMIMDEPKDDWRSYVTNWCNERNIPKEVKDHLLIVLGLSVSTLR